VPGPIGEIAGNTVINAVHPHRKNESRQSSGTSPITEHLEEMEEVYLAQNVLERVRSGKEDVVPLEQLIDEYGAVDANGVED